MSSTILIIEDDPALLKMYAEKFKLEGFNVIEAKDGEEGIKQVSERKPDLILLDMMLPKFSGQDLLAHFQQNIKENSIAVIALTNLAQKEEAKKALELGAKEYLVKAMYTPEEVVKKVKQYLDLSK
jgi:DNA-binding response OmpR family regulator